MITIDTIKTTLTNQTYIALTGDNDIVAQNAIDRAVIWLQIMTKNCNVNIDYNNDEIELILLNQTIYELYQIDEFEKLAIDKKEDALTLLKAFFGNCINVDKVMPSVSIVIPKTNLSYADIYDKY